jgi:hypothetical protein
LQEATDFGSSARDEERKTTGIITAEKAAKSLNLRLNSTKNKVCPP